MDPGNTTRERVRELLVLGPAKLEYCINRTRLQATPGLFAEDEQARSKNIVGVKDLFSGP